MSARFANIILDPALPVALLLVLGLFLAGFFLLAFWRRMPGTWWRLGAAAIAFAILWNPILVREQRNPLNDVALVIVDESESQSIGERRATTEKALAELRRRLEKKSGLDLRVVRSEGNTPGGRSDGTHLIGAMERALGEIPADRLAGVILLTDGQVHDLPADPATAAPKAPLHVLLTGVRNEVDRRLAIEQVPNYGIVGEKQVMVLRLLDPSLPAGQRLRLKLFRDGELVYNRLATGNDSWQVPFLLENGGRTILEVEVEAADSELTLRNNRAVVSVNGVRDRLRVLLVSGEPHAGERTWRNILKSDPAVDLVHFTILRPPEKHDGTPIRELSLISFPTRQLFQKRLKDFDLIIFDRYRRRGVLPDLYLRNVVNYVRAGGAVLTAAGPSFATRLSLYRTPLSAVLPAAPTGKVISGAFKPKLTDLGRRHPVTSSLSGGNVVPPKWGRWLRMIDTDAKSGEVLMRGSGDRPLLILERVGEGRVAQILSDHIWLWSRGYEGGGPQVELLRRIAHWLMKEPELEEEDLQALEVNGKLRITRRSLRPDKSNVTVTTPSGKSLTVALEKSEFGADTATIEAPESGLYKLNDGKRSAVAAVGETNPREFSDVLTTGEILAPPVKASGGGIFWLADGLPDPRRVKPGNDAFGRSWLGLYAHGGYTVTGVDRIALMPGWFAVVLIIGLLLLGWRQEGR